MRELDIKRLALNVADTINDAVGDIHRDAFDRLVLDIEDSIHECMKENDDD